MPTAGRALWNALLERGLAFGDRTAIASAHGNLSFAELYAAAKRLAASLSASGIDQGDLVVLSLPNTPDFAIAFLALASLDASIALVSTKYGSSECAAVRAGLRPRAFVTAKNGGLPVAAIGEAEVTTIEEQRSNGPLVVAITSPRAESRNHAGIALVKLSSGSTGTPKGIALTAANLMAEAEAITSSLDVGPSDRIVAPVPLFHSYGFDVGLLTALWSGATLLVRDAFVPRQSWRDLTDPATTIFLGVPAMYRFLLETTPAAAAADLGHVRYLLSCTAPLTEALIASFHDRFGVAICQHYGSSETGAACNHVPANVMTKPSSVGKRMRGVEIRVIDDEGRAVPTGCEGEIEIASAAVAAGYVMGAPIGRTPLEPPRFRTGDLGFIDADGFVTVHGRRDDVINVGGLKVYPLEIVRVLEEHPLVGEAAACAMRDRGGEEVVYAAAAVTGNVTAADLIAFCRGKMADYRVPRRIDLMKELPRGPTGKVRVVAPEEAS